MQLQILTERASIPEEDLFDQWMNKISYEYDIKGYELTIRVVEPAESKALNAQFLGKSKPTNVLSFPAELPDFAEQNYLGDIVICADVVELEAHEQNKLVNAHWAHMLVHGVLHLRGYDHILDHEAEEMEALEVEMLKLLGFTNPYKT